MNGRENKPPIFLFCSGMRSGSTLLQRLIIASGETMVFGETGGALDHLRIAWDGYRQMLGDGGARFPGGLGGNGDLQRLEFEAAGEERPHLWIPCINPAQSKVEHGFRSFFEDLYGAEARRLGYSRWGVKKVRSELDTARFMRTLFPEAKFVFLVRDPIACLTSIKQYNWMDHPGDPSSLDFYIQQWRRTAHSFIDADFGITLRYEDVISLATTRRELFEYLGIAGVDDGFFNHSRIKGHGNKPVALSFLERRKVKQLTKAERSAFRYA